MAILETQDLSISFGGLHAVRDVSLKVEEGSLTSIIGPNGAGQDDPFQSYIGQLQADQRLCTAQG